MKNTLSFLLGICFSASLSAQDPGDIDLNYGIDGIATFSFVGQSTALNSISRQSNDRIIIGGYMQDLATLDPYVIATRMDETGSVDDFGNNITFFANHFDDPESIMATYVLPDDEIIIAGFYGEGFPFVSRLHDDGINDHFFAGTGSYTNESISFVPTCMDVYNTVDGYNIVMSGYSNDYKPYLLMLDQNGDEVSTFGSNGLYEFTGSEGIMTKLVVDTDEGCIYACGRDISGVNSFITKHKLSDGSLITSFNGTGFVLLEPFGDAINFSVNGLAFNAVSGNLAIFGYYYHTAGDYDIFAVRLNTSDGSFDNSFGLNGWSTMRTTASTEIIYDAIQQSNGKYYLAGLTTIGGTNDILIGRVNNNGTIDLSFGDNGFAITDLGKQEMVLELELSEDQGRIFAGVDYQDFGYHNMKVACYHTGFLVDVPENNILIDNQLMVFPNPATELITIESEKEDNYTIEVYDQAGKFLKSENQSGKKLHLNVSEIQEGIYLLKVISSDLSIRTTKIIIQ